MEKSRLLSFTSPVFRESLLSNYAGQTVGIDAESLIFNIFHSLRGDCILNDPISPLKELFFNAIDFLISLNIKPVLVFNGANLPNKQERLEYNQDIHSENQQKAQTFIQQGYKNRVIQIIRENFKISFDLVKDLQSHLKEQEIICITAPFESLAQLSYLNAISFVDVIYTDNPQIFIYNPKIVILHFSFLKNRSNLFVAEATSEELLEFYDMSKDRFAQMCCVAGECYSLPVIDWNVQELQLMYQSKMPFTEIVHQMREVIPSLPDDYASKVIKEVKTVFHQLVYDPQKEQLVPLNPCKEALPKNFNKDELMRVVKCEINPSKIHEIQNYGLQWNSSAEVSPKRKNKKQNPGVTLKMASILSFFQTQPAHV